MLHLLPHLSLLPLYFYLYCGFMWLCIHTAFQLFHPIMPANELLRKLI